VIIIGGMAKKVRFPTLAVIVFVFAIVWLLSDLSIIKWSIPWFPVVILIISFGWIFNRLQK